jgi:hypothetical protein
MRGKGGYGKATIAGREGADGCGWTGTDGLGRVVALLFIRVYYCGTLGYESILERGGDRRHSNRTGTD